MHIRNPQHWQLYKRNSSVVCQTSQFPSFIPNLLPIQQKHGKWGTPGEVNQQCKTCTYSKVHITYFTTSISVPLLHCVLKSSHRVQMFWKTTFFQTTRSVKKRNDSNYVTTQNKVLLEVLTGTQPVMKFPSHQGSSLTTRKPANGP
jgi:hypothetical protein